MAGITEERIREVFDTTLAKFGADVKWAAFELDLPAFTDRYNYGMIVYFPCEEILTMEEYDEQRVWEIQQKMYPKIFGITDALTEACKEAGIPFEVPPVPPTHQQPPYLSPFSSKYAGYKSGIGWIGKNNLLITYDYGPQIGTVGAVFYADHMTVKPPVTVSECGTCDLCVKACPYRNIKGVDWKDGEITRDDQVDYDRCNKIRFAAQVKLGRKMACAKCEVACPHGSKIP